MLQTCNTFSSSTDSRTTSESHISSPSMGIEYWNLYEFERSSAIECGVENSIYSVLRLSSHKSDYDDPSVLPALFDTSSIFKKKTPFSVN